MDDSITPEMMMERKKRAEQLLVRHLFEGKSYDQCWYEVVGKCSAHSATEACASELAWYRETFPADVESALCICGLDEYAVLMELSDLLFTTRTLAKTTVKRKLPDGRTEITRETPFRDLQAVDVGLHHWSRFMGFYGRDRPPAVYVDTAQQRPASAIEAAGDNDDDDAATDTLTPAMMARRKRAAQLMIRRFFEKKPRAQCWREVEPESKYSTSTAAAACDREIAWHRKTFPVDMKSALVLCGLDEYAVFMLVSDLLFRTCIPVKTTVKRKLPDGSIKTTEEYKESSCSDLKAVEIALRYWSLFKGYRSKNRPRTVFSLDPEQQLQAREIEAAANDHSAAAMAWRAARRGK